MKIIRRYTFAPYQLKIESEAEHRYLMGLLKLSPLCQKNHSDGFDATLHERFKEFFMQQFDGRCAKNKEENE